VQGSPGNEKRWKREGVRLREPQLHNIFTRRRFTYNKITNFICFCLYNTFILNEIKEANQAKGQRKRGEGGEEGGRVRAGG